MLDHLRKKIDKIDLKIAENLLKRYKITLEIASYKQKQGMATEDIDREKEHLAKLTQNCTGKTKIYLKNIFTAIFTASKHIQNNKE